MKKLLRKMIGEFNLNLEFDWLVHQSDDDAILEVDEEELVDSETLLARVRQEKLQLQQI